MPAPKDTTVEAARRNNLYVGRLAQFGLREGHDYLRVRRAAAKNDMVERIEITPSGGHKLLEAVERERNWRRVAESERPR